MDLHLNVKQCFFDQHRAGNKPFEYRLDNEYWRKGLVGRNYDNLYYKAGYPKKNDTSKIDVMSYRGYEMKTISHPLFGKEPVRVFAIKLTKGQEEEKKMSDMPKQIWALECRASFMGDGIFYTDADDGGKQYINVEQLVAELEKIKERPVTMDCRGLDKVIVSINPIVDQAIKIVRGDEA